MAVIPSLLLHLVSSSHFTKSRHLFSFSFSTTLLQSQPPPIRVALTDTVGRAVFATRPIPTGDLIHTAQPAVCHPSPSSLHSVCYSCLARLSNPSASPFCSHRCHQRSKVRFLASFYSSFFHFIVSLSSIGKLCIVNVM